MLRGVVRHMAATNKIIVDKAQGGRKPFLVMDQPTIEFGLDPIVSPALLTKGRQLHKGSNLHMKHGKVRPAGTGVKVSLLVGVLRGAEVVARFRQIDSPGHTCSQLFRHTVGMCSPCAISARPKVFWYNISLYN